MTVMGEGNFTRNGGEASDGGGGGGYNGGMGNFLSIFTQLAVGC